ncbi:MAG: efflux RND transporter periplasmic adaptor subunit [bacterium]
MKYITLIFSFALTFFLLSCSQQQEKKTTQGADAVVTQSAEYYTCPMHPSVISDKPGACPVCGMALVKKMKPQETSSNDMDNLRAVTLSPTQRVLANVATAPVERTSSVRSVSAVGVVSYAEPNQANVSAWFRGRIEKLYVNYTGQEIKKGQPLFELHSPDLISAEQELILAQSSAAVSSGNDTTSRQRTLEAARERLHIHFGMTDEQIAETEKMKQPRMSVTFHSPIHGTVISKEVQEGQYVDEGMVLYRLVDLSKVWIYLDVYEKDIRFVKMGTSVYFTSDTYPNERFHGTATFIDPVINEETRTVRVRIESNNINKKLKPNMFVQATITVPFTSNVLVPSSAVMLTGKRSVVWVEVKPNVFEPRDVVVGTSSDTKSEILNGLNEGEQVAVSGGFLIDSESALRQPTSADPHAGHRTQKANTAQTPVPSSDQGHNHTTMESDQVTDVNITVDGSYSPDTIRVKLGKKIRLHFTRHEDSECTSEVIFDQFNIRRKLPPHQTVDIEITPAKPGTYDFHCGMGMVHGTLIVDDKGVRR